MSVVELYPEDLGIVLIELDLVLGLDPLPGFNVGFGRQVLVALRSGARVGAFGSSNGRSDGILVDIVGLDIGVEAMEEQGRDFEEGEDESEEERETGVEDWVLVGYEELEHGF